MTLLDINTLKITFQGANGPLEVVRGLDLKIERGTIHGLIGESGCGKTMTGMALLGLVPTTARVSAHTLRFDDIDLQTTDSTTIRGRRIAMISQDPAAALNPVLSIGRQLDDVLRVHSTLSKAQRRERAVSLLADTGLADPARVYRRYPHELSGGMQQRVVIAQALATGAEFIVADEPTTALDVSVEAQILALLQGLVRERGLTVLMITHDMSVVRRTCSRVTVLYAGIAVEDGPVEQVLTSPWHPYTQALLAALPNRAMRGQRLQTIDGIVPTPSVTLPGCVFADRCRHALPLCSSEKPSLRRHAKDHDSRCQLEVKNG